MKFKINLSFAVALAMSCLVVAGCSLSYFVPDQNENNKSKSFEIDFNESGWKKIDPDSSDYAYVHRESQSILMANSLCKKYEATDLEDLLSNILGGIKDLTTEKVTKIKFSDRDAIRTEANGKLDGVSISLIVQTVKKNRCIYDFVLITPSSKVRLENKDYYERFLNSASIE